MAFLVAPNSIAGAVSLDEAKLHSKVENDEENDLLQRLIEAATARAEQITRRVLMSRSMTLISDSLGPVINLMTAPVQSVQSVKYIDRQGGLQTLSPSLWRLLPHPLEPKLILSQAAQRPDDFDTAYGEGAVVVEFTAGYENITSVPSAIRSWILLHVGMLYENREVVAVDRSVQMVELPHVGSLLDPYRIPRYS